MAEKSKKVKNRKKWYRLDNAATIYPVMSNRSWMAMFRLCATLTEDVDKDILEEALRSAVRRFPTMAVRVRRGFFWHYLEHVEGIPPVTLDVANPCLPLKGKDNNHFLFRVRYYKRRIALEFFHVLTDGSGGMCFLKTLVAEYLRLKYGADIPRGATVLDCSEEPRPEEMEDSFPKFAGKVPLARGESTAYHLRGTEEHKHFLNITTGILESGDVAARAKELGVSVTHYLCAVLIQSIADIQRRDRHRGSRKQPIKICIPVNLRRIFGSSTVRNFSSYVNPGIERKYGEYSLAETAKIVQHQMGLETTPQHLRAKFTANVLAESNPIVRFVPLFVKIMILQIVYRATGDVQTTSTISNLGVVTLPAEMENYVERLDFQLGPLYQNKLMCGALSYKGKLYVNFTRKLRESDVERGFFTRLVEECIPVTIESNMNERSLME